MRWKTLPVELFLLALLGVFLLYPLAYVVPGAAGDEHFDVHLIHLGTTEQEKIAVLELLHQSDLLRDGPLPRTIASLGSRTKANALARTFRDAGAEIEVVAVRTWTTFYFEQALGFEVQRRDAFPYVSVQPVNPFLWECLRNSLLLGILTTVLTTILCLPLACWFTRYQFPGRTVLSTLLLVPLILPPFVGAIGLENLLFRFRTVNLFLMHLGILAPNEPIDWLGGGGLAGVVLMQVLHLYPILFLNLAAAWANVDPTLEDAARNLGASEWRVFRTVTFPLLLPGYFAGASIVFVWAFTDLGTPLVFNVANVIPVQIYNQVSDPQATNPTAYALVVVTLVVTCLLFFSARWFVQRQTFFGGGKGAVAVAPLRAGRGHAVLIHACVYLLTLTAALPMIGVTLTAFAGTWDLTALPESYTTEFVRDVFHDRMTVIAIRNSVLFSGCSTCLDLVLGVTIAWLVVRRPGWLTGIIDGIATLPLALPGLVLAFGYLTCYTRWNVAFLDPGRNPVPLLIIAYTIRRLPFLTRSALAGLQQVAPSMEEAAENLGASRWRVLRTVTVPLIAANLVAGAVLTFAFAMLEVSDSLMLAREEQYYPITKAILGILARPTDGDRMASALALYATCVLVVGLVAASITLGRKMGELFRA